VSREIRVHVSVVIRDRDRYLMVREGNEASHGRWNVPGGHLEPDETLEAAAWREANEEASVGIGIDGLLGVYTGDVGPTVRSVRFVYTGHLVTGEPAAADDVLEVRWWTPDEILAAADEDLVAAEMLRRIVADASLGLRWSTGVVRE
jgi:ADP-ribose pyrophosphatase YjhB (NUDIX family)